MRSDYHDRKRQRIARLRERAGQAGEEADQAGQAARDIGSHIPLGQPILLGHHSEKRHRRDLARIDANMRKSVEAGRREEELNRRADAAEANTAISSDDPDALALLRGKLERLEAKQARMKRVNAAFRKGDAALASLGFNAEDIAAMREKVAKGYSWETVPYVDWELKNNNANIRRIRERIVRLERQERAIHQELPFEGGRLVIDPAENRVQLFFDERPSKEKCRALSSAGFRWAPTLKAWQRHYSPAAIYYAKVQVGLPLRENGGAQASGSGQAGETSEK